jgi:conjugative relaxase-like TrwC/TraI family protein
MLNLSKPMSAETAQRYHKTEFISKEQNYWSQGDVIAGQWQGRLAMQLGLTGAVSAEDFARLSEGQHPGTGEQLVRHLRSHEYHNPKGRTVKTMEHRAGWDATFSAPKSVSLTALVGGDDRVRQAHYASVSTALKQLEPYTQARIGKNDPPETTGKFIVARFEHDTARPVDGYAAPHLHTHAVLFNLTGRENGQARPLDIRSLIASKEFATAVYRSELAYQLKELGYEITAGRSGAPEIKGYTQEYLYASSPRTQQIREHLELTGRNGWRASEIARFKTRDRKEIRSPDEVMTAHRKLADGFGHQADAVVRAARERQQHREKPTNTLDRARESLTFSRDQNFERVAVVTERALLLDGLRHGMGDLTLAQLRADLDARIATGEFRTVERARIPGRQFTTARTIAAEHEIIRQIWDGRNHVQPILPRPQAIAFADQHHELNRTQRTVVEDVLSTPDRIQGIQGFAGSSKTVTLSLIRTAAETRSFEVEGFVSNYHAARQLGDAGIRAGSLQEFLTRSTGPAPPELRHFYFVDQSSLTSSFEMRDFLLRIASQDRVVLVGDPGQQKGFSALQDFEHLQEAGMRTAKLDEIARQKDPALKSAIELLARGQVSAALDALQKEGHVREIPDTDGRIRVIARSFADSSARTLIVTPDNASRQALNAAVRQELKAHGILAPGDHSFKVLVQRQDMSGAKRLSANNYQIHDVVRYARGSKTTGIEADSHGTVVAISRNANRLSIENASGETVTYNPRYLGGVSVYRDVQREFSIGDRIQFTVPNLELRVHNRDLAVIEAIAPEGRISARLDNHHLIEFDATEFRHFDHGYAVTSDSIQRLTAERVLVNANTDIYANLFNSRFGYVSISGASHEVTIFTDSITRLNPRVDADVSRNFAFEISQSPSVTQGIGIGM